MPRLKRTTLILLVLLSCVGCDQVTKQIARQSLATSNPISLLGDSLRLQYVENRGAFLSLGANIPEHWRFGLLTLLTGCFLVALVLYLLRSKGLDRATSITLALVTGGGIGNLIDRLVHQGRVVDFLNLGVGPVRTGIFNVADIAITFGTLWLGFLWFRQRKLSAKDG